MKSEEEAHSNSELFRSRASSGGFFFMCFIFLGLVVESIFSSQPKIIVITCAWAATAIATFYILMHKPKIFIFDEGLQIVNPISSHTIPWSDVKIIDTRFTLSVTLADGRRIYAWAAPAPGRYHSRRLHSSDLKGLDIAQQSHIKAGQSPRSDSGAAYILVSARFNQFTSNSAGIKGIAARSSRDWTAPIIIAVATLIAVALQ